MSGQSNGAKPPVDLADARGDAALDAPGLARVLTARAKAVIERCRAAGVMTITAESCTGGMLSTWLTEVPGSSDVVERGVVTYANAAKTALLGVPESLLAAHGAVSEACARAMAEGALRGPAAAGAGPRLDLALAVTGIAGPGGGTEAKPEGLVHFAAARRDAPTLHVELRYGALGRNRVRSLATARALALALEALRLR